MVERFLSQTTFSSQEDYRKNPSGFRKFQFRLRRGGCLLPPNSPTKGPALDQRPGRRSAVHLADIKRESDRTASWFRSLGIGKGDVVMLILKRRYEFWFSIVALHKLGAVVIPATHLLTKKMSSTGVTWPASRRSWRRASR